MDILESALYIAGLGFKIFPAQREDKRPMKGFLWKQDCSSDPVTINYWLSENKYNYGVVMGEHSRCFVVDIDDEEAWEKVQVDNNVKEEPTLSVKTANGRHLYYAYPKGLKAFGNSPGSLPADKIQIRGEGGYVVGPGSLHESGIVYSHNGLQIVTAPDWLIGLIMGREKYFTSNTPQPKKSDKMKYFSRREAYFKTALENAKTTIESAYQGTRNNTLNRAAFKIGQIIELSPYSETTIVEILASYATSIGLHHDESIATTLSGLRAGMRQPKDLDFLYDDEPVENIYQPDEEVFERPEDPVSKTSTSKVFTFPDELVDQAPGILGQMAQWMNDTALYKQPALALASAATVLGVLKGHKYVGPFNIRTNLYCLGLAPSGNGKDHYLKAATNILRFMGEERLVGGRFASTAGILKMMKDRNGLCFCPIDEFGRILVEMVNAKPSSPNATTAALLMELFSSAGSTVYGSQYANRDGKSPREDVDFPHLCLYGTSTESSLWETLSSKEAGDGLLARFLMFYSDKTYKNFTAPKFERTTPPLYLITQLERYKRDIQFDVYDPKLIPMCFTDEAEVKREEARIRWRTFSNNSGSDSISSIFNRAEEHAIKLSMIASDDTTISADVFNWAVKVIDSCLEYTLDRLVSCVGDSDYHKRYLSCVNIIRSNPGISKRELIRRFHRIEPKQRDILIADVSQDYRIKEDVIQNHNNTTTTTYYYVDKA